LEAKLFYLGNDETRTKSHYYLRHVNLLRKVLNADDSEEAVELLTGLGFVLTGDQDYLIDEGEK